MAIKETEVWVGISGNNVEYYENKGYEIPRRIDKQGRLLIKKGTKILVKIEDLQKTSKTKLTKICDYCECETPNQPYEQIVRRRKLRGKDSCENCKVIKSVETRISENEANWIINADPEFAKLFLNIEDTYKNTCYSNKKADFKCPHCGNKVKNRLISNVYRRGKISCPCDDGLPYTEKFMYYVLNQLKIKFEFHKIFKWSQSKLYDFYLNEFNIIIEVHGLQHYDKRGFGNLEGARTSDEERENDELKETLALKNGIKKYITIDCRKSNMEYIKTNILASQLNNLYDLSEINWLKCHEFACHSLVKKSCSLWNEGNSVREISKIFKLSTSTISKYLKQGKELDFCEYDGKKEQKKLYEKKQRAIIQFYPNGETLEWKSMGEVEKKLKIRQGSISNACIGRAKTAGGFKWMYKEEYEKSISTQT